MEELEKFGKIVTALMIAWFIVVAGFGIVLSLINGTFFKRRTGCVVLLDNPPNKKFLIFPQLFFSLGLANDKKLGKE